MAKLNWQKPAMDAVIAVGGGTLLKGWVGGIEMVSNLVGNLPADVAGIDVQLALFAAVALIVVKNYLMK